MNQASLDKVKAMQWPVLEPLDPPGPARPVALNRPVCVAGARPDINLTIVSPQVSKTHAIFVTDGSAVYIRDLASLNRVYLNDVPVRETTLINGDIVRMGPMAFRCHSGFDRPGKNDLPLEPLELYEVDTGKGIVIEGHTAVLGRRDGCDVQLERNDVEQVHAVIFAREGRWFVRDLRSRTHTFVNDAPVAEAELNLGDSLRIGSTELHCGPLPQLDPLVEDKETPVNGDGTPINGDRIPLNGEETPEATEEPQVTEAPELSPTLEALVIDDDAPDAENVGPAASPDRLPVEPLSEERVRPSEPPEEEPRADRLESLALELSDDLDAHDKVTRQLEADELEASELPSDESDELPAEEPEPEPFAAEALMDKPREDAFDWADEENTLATSAVGEATESMPLKVQSNQAEAELAFSELLDKVVGDVQRVQSAWQELIAMRHTQADLLQSEFKGDAQSYPLSGAKHERSSRKK